MSKRIEFKRTREFLGRNGVGQMTGLLIDRQTKDLYLAPITSRKTIGRAYMLLPRDQAKEVADVILEMAR